MKELLLKRKAGFIKYLCATFLFNIERFLGMLLFSFILNAINKGNLDSYSIVVICTIAFIIYSPISYLVSRMFRIGFMRDTILDIRRQAFDKIMALSMKQFSVKSKEIYISNLINDINTFENKFFYSLLNFLIETVLFAMSLIILFFLDLKLAIVMILVCLGLFSVSNLLNDKAKRLIKEVSKENEQFTLNMGNTFNGMEILKLNNIEDKFLDKSIHGLNRLERSKFKSTIFTDMQRNVVMTIGYVIMVFIMIYLSMFYLQYGANLGMIAFIFQLSTRMSFSLVSAFPYWNAISASVKIYEKITKPQEAIVGKAGGNKEFEFGNNIKLNNVSFSYDNKLIFNNVSFTIEKGKKYLIKGASGAGKSTLMKLLAMTYDDYIGEIYVDSVNYKDVSESSFHQKVAFIYQDVFLFEDTIKNNITLYKDIAMDKVNHAVKLCGLTSILDDKKDGLDEILQENGKNLSGGQRQRISIARAIAKEADILFVDEGTSSLNQELGKEIEKVFLSLPNTVISISHRYYEGVTNEYDYVLEIKNGHVYQFEAKDYFGEVITC